MTCQSPATTMQTTAVQPHSTQTQLMSRTYTDVQTHPHTCHQCTMESEACEAHSPSVSRSDGEDETAAAQIGFLRSMNAPRLLYHSIFLPLLGEEPERGSLFGSHLYFYNGSFSKLWREIQFSKYTASLWDRTVQGQMLITLKNETSVHLFTFCRGHMKHWSERLLFSLEGLFVPPITDRVHLKTDSVWRRIKDAQGGKM